VFVTCTDCIINESEMNKEISGNKLQYTQLLNIDAMKSQIMIVIMQ